MSLRSVAQRLGAKTEAEVRALHRRYVQGLIDKEQLVALVATVVNRANHQGAAAADISVALQLTRSLGVAVLPVGVAPPDDDAQRLERAARTITRKQFKTATSAEDAERMRANSFGQLGRSEPPRAVEVAARLAMSARPEVHGWTRGTGTKPCPLCKSLADGAVLPVGTPMARHAGCACVPIPVTT